MIASATRFLRTLVGLPHGEPFLEALTQFLVDALDVDLAFIAAREGEALVPLAVGAREGADLRLPPVLVIAGSPCEVVLAAGRAAYPRGLVAAFPACAPAATLGFEAYVGVALRDDDGRPMGVVAVAREGPLADPAEVGDLLDLVAPRAQLELRARRHRAQLAESEERYRKLVELSPDLVMVHAGGRWVFANATAARVLGAPSPAALVGRPLADVVPTMIPADVERCCATHHGCCVPDFEIRLLRRLDGTLLEVAAASSPISFGGKPACMVVFRDVTEQKRTATSLAEAQRIARIGSFEWDLVADAHWWSDELYRLLGLGQGGVAPSMAALVAAIDPFDRPALEAALAACRTAARPFRLDVSAAAGSRRLECRGRVLADPAGRPLRIVGTAQDVSEARRSAIALQASEARFRSVVATAGEAIVLANDRNEIILWNPGATRIFGYEMTETLGRPLGMLMPARFREAHAAGLAAAAGRGAMDLRRSVELVGLHKDGHEFPIELSLTYWEAEGDRYFTGLIRDISERRAVEAMKESFVAMISHELRTPLNTIMCSLDLLGSGAVGPLGEKAARIAAIAQENTDRLARIVGDILDLQVLEQGRMTILREPCELAAVVRAAIDTCAPMAEHRHLVVETAIEPPDLTADADAGRLTQTLVNLLVNAIRYSPPGGRIDVRVAQRQGDVEVRVEDQGPGIPPPERELVFERFYQATPPAGGQDPGTGLGLAICRAIVQQHGGRIWIEASPRRGAAFVFTFPARTSPP